MPPTAHRGPLARRTAYSPLAGVILLAPLLLGGTRPAVQIALAGCAAAAVLWALRHARPDPPVWLWIPLLIAGWGLAQCVPLPPSISGSPWRTGWGPISLDVPATLIATAHQAAFALVAIAAHAADARGRRALGRALIRTAGLTAAIGLVHWAAGAQHIFGLVPPLDRPALSGYFSVFVNPNTLAGFLVLGAALALGRFAAAGSEPGRRRAAALGVLAAGGAVLSGSRGGQAALVLAALIFGALAFTHRARVGEERARRPRAVAIGAAIGALSAITAAVLLLPDWGADPRLDGRLRTWRECLPLLADVWPVGIGRGAFETVFPTAQQAPVDGTVTHPETIGLQLALEWGAPAALAALAAGIGAWLVAFRRSRRAFDPTRWGLVAGLAAVGAQQMVDFGFEAMGLSLPVAAALGLALGPTGQPEPSAQPAQPGSRTPIAAAALALLLLALIGGPWALRHTADADVARIREAADVAAVQTAADHALARHPPDALAPLTAAVRLAALGAPGAMTLARLNQALSRAPADHRPHLLAARLLRGDRPAQAAVEYRMAIGRAPWHALRLVREAATLRAPGHLARAVPPDQRGRLGEVLLEAGRAADARDAMAAILLVEPTERVARHIHARACLQLGDAPCVEGDIGWLDAHGPPAAAHALRARLALREGDADSAARAADAALATAPEDPGARRLAAEVAGARGDLEAARGHYTALFRRVGSQPAAAAEVLAIWGRLERRLGDPARGRRMLKQAAHLDPRFAAEAARARDTAAPTLAPRRPPPQTDGMRAPAPSGP